MSAEASRDHLIVFLRHGESVGNAEDRFQGQADFPLTEDGRDQASALARRWLAEEETFDQAIASPLLRARETAEIVCSALKVPLEFDPDWMEINNGLLAGLSGEEAAQRLPRPDFMTPYDRYGRTGESRWELYLRAGRCIQKLLDRPAGKYLVVAHGGILGMAMYAMLSIAPQAEFHGPRFVFENTTFATMLYQPARHNWRMLAFDNRAHWKPED
jgi:2,3-bisphosphoglycerate-dependent phosphoglycerate mutase